MADYNGRTFEFVSKSEIKIVKNEIDLLIRKLQSVLRTEGITFQPALVGSAGRSLVTKQIGGNKGYDFDYNFSIQKSPDINAKQLKLIFIKKLNALLQGTNYKQAEDNTQAMTIKVVDTRNSRIVHSCDFAIVNEYEENGDFFQEILVRDKNDNSYKWNKRPFGKNYDVKIANLLANGLWEELKQEYLKLKNRNNDPEKKSYPLYYEAINNVYNRYSWI